MGRPYQPPLPNEPLKQFEEGEDDVEAEDPSREEEEAWAAAQRELDSISHEDSEDVGSSEDDETID